MKTILCIDCSIIVPYGNQEERITQYYNGLCSIFKHKQFFIDNHIDIIVVDNTIDSLDTIPIIKNCIPPYIQVLLKKINNIGLKNKGAGVIEHWKMSHHIRKNYDFFIHFEARQTLQSLYFFKEFIKQPMNIFTWAHKNKNAIVGIYTNKDKRFKLDQYGIDNHNFMDKDNFNDYYTGLFSIHTSYLTKYIQSIDLNDMICKSISLEKSLMCFSYYELDIFKIIDKVHILRGGDKKNYDSIQQN